VDSAVSRQVPLVNCVWVVRGYLWGNSVSSCANPKMGVGPCPLSFTKILDDSGSHLAMMTIQGITSRDECSTD
jgi:hypothetical protein